MRPARVLNVAAALILSRTDPKQETKIRLQLNGRFHTMGKPIPKDEENAPYWWQGDEEAYESTMAALEARPRRRR